MTAAERLKEVEKKIADLNIRIVNAGGGGGGAHNFLSATHPDTDPDSPVRGDIVRGIAGPEWQRYAIGAAGRFLRSDGVDPAWDTIQAADLPAHAAEHEVGGGDLIDHNKLTNLQGGQAGEYYHLNATEHPYVSGVNAQSLLTTASPSFVNITDTGVAATNLAAGTIGERPGGVVGDIRYNSTLGRFEVYTGVWQSILLTGNVGIADNDILSVDGVPVANDYAKFTASGLLGRSYDEVLSDLSGQALAAFDWNDQDLTSIGATELYGDIKTDRWLLQDSNTFVGVDVCGAGNLANTTGSEGYRNSFFGNQAGNAITIGASNNFFGYQAGLANTTGNYNSFFGHGAGYANIGGGGNSFFGHGAGRLNTEGNYNCSLGWNAGRYQSDGSSALQTPENSVYIGKDTKSGSVPAGGEDDISNEIVIGYNTIGNGSNTVTLGNTDIVTTVLRGNVGIDVSTFGANAVNVLAIPNGTPPAAAVADEIQIYSKDSSDGAANATLALMLEQAVEIVGTFTPSHKIKVWINGAEYWLQLDAV